MLKESWSIEEYVIYFYFSIGWARSISPFQSLIADIAMNYLIGNKIKV